MQYKIGIYRNFTKIKLQSADIATKNVILN